MTFTIFPNSLDLLYIWDCTHKMPTKPDNVKIVDYVSMALRRVDRGKLQHAIKSLCKAKHLHVEISKKIHQLNKHIHTHTHLFTWTSSAHGSALFNSGYTMYIADSRFQYTVDNFVE